MPTYTPIAPVTVDTLSTPPNTGDIANFDSRADIHVQEVVDMVPQINSANDINYNNALAAHESAIATAADVIAVGAIKDLAVIAKDASVIAQGLSEDAKDASELAAIAAAASALAAATGGGLPVVPGAVGSVVTWNGSAWVSVLPATPSIPTSTGDVVPSGSLLAIDDVGFPMSVDSISTSVIQATASIGAMHAIGLSNGNTAVFWRVSGGTDMRMMVVSQAGATVLASTSVGACANTSNLWSCQLVNGNIVLVFMTSTTAANFKIITTAGASVVASTSIVALPAYSIPKVCALTGGGFAVACSDSSVAVTVMVYAYSSAGVLGTSSSFAGGGNDLANIGIAATASGGFAVYAGGAGVQTVIKIYNSSCTLLYSQILNSTAYGISIASKSGAILTTGYYTYLETRSGSSISASKPTYMLSPDNSVGTENNPSGYSIGVDGGEFKTNSANSINASSAVLGDGRFISFFSAKESYIPPVVSIINSTNNTDVQTCFEESTYSNLYDTAYVVPKGQNGFNLVWVATNKNIKFAHVKSGKIIGISLGQSGANTIYKTSGEATDLTSNNMLNVGGRAVEVNKLGKKVFI